MLLSPHSQKLTQFIIQQIKSIISTPSTNSFTANRPLWVLGRVALSHVLAFFYYYFIIFTRAIFAQAQVERIACSRERRRTIIILSISSEAENIHLVAYIIELPIFFFDYLFISSTTFTNTTIYVSTQIHLLYIHTYIYRDSAYSWFPLLFDFSVKTKT